MIGSAVTRLGLCPAARYRGRARPNRPGQTIAESDISKFLRLTRIGAVYLVTFVIVAAGSIWLALQVAPMQTVSAAGQTAQVGAAVPD